MIEFQVQMGQLRVVQGLVRKTAGGRLWAVLDTDKNGAPMFRLPGGRRVGLPVLREMAEQNGWPFKVIKMESSTWVQ